MGGSASKDLNRQVTACVNGEANLEEALGDPTVNHSNSPLA